MNKIIWIAISILIFSLPAYALRDPQIPDGTLFTYSEITKIDNENILKSMDSDPEAKASKKYLNTELFYTFKVNSFKENDIDYYTIDLKNTNYPSLNESYDKSPGRLFTLKVKNDLSPIALQYRDISPVSSFGIGQDLSWDYSKKILHYTAINIYGKKQNLKYDVNLKNGTIYGDAISAYPLGLLYIPGFTGKENSKELLKTLAPYTQTFGMPIIESDLITSDKIEEIVTPAGKFKCHKVTVIPRPPTVYKPFLFLIGILSRFGDMFSQTYWITDTAPYIAVKYHINIMSIIQRDGILQKLELNQKEQLAKTKQE